ncbi:MAG: AAA family ATPase [Lentisphaerae bacterium]|jgi:ATP-dependent 26S proteasome regulatory subunit|nr:AAA family ATPase [Lentisphaerota bacterium]MBT7057064.1 AAA family ATPase [Lentisphaerota bacterium]MBT7845536.1 AAA family ATPase [Lentisphaerota bacterium]
MQRELIDRVRAGFSGFCIVTAEETRAERVVQAVAQELGYQLYSWSITDGLLCPSASSVRDMPDPLDAVNAVTELPENSILLLKDFQHFLGETGQPPDPILVRAVRDRTRDARSTGKVIILTGCAIELPLDLRKEFTTLEMELPDRQTLVAIARQLAQSAEIEVDDATIESAAESARGLTTVEAEDLMALSLVTCRTLDASMIAREKAKTIGHDGILELVEPSETVDDIGGLENLKAWLAKRRNAFGDAARAFGLPNPKGALILGIPGTGKSLSAKVASSILRRPILRLDAGRLFAGIVGQSEANLRRATQTAEAIAPCILWIDEIEKGMSGSRGNGANDGGTTARVFGSFLSWMQEKTSPVFVIATANDVTQLPPELLRKGRFDELFFVDLPDEGEREAIWRIHVRHRERDDGNLDVNAFVKLSDGFTGSEIEQAVIDAMFDCFDNGDDLSTGSVIHAIQNTVPLSVTMAEDIERLRKWATNRARPASTGAASVPQHRRIAA